MHALWVRHEQGTGGMIRWEHSRPSRNRVTQVDEVICQWCGETVAREIRYNPRHADSVQEAVAICHGLVEYHLIAGCPRDHEEGKPVA
jgi:hypothetical protein